MQISGTSTTSGSATSVDPKGYLTSLNSVVLKTDAEIGDIKRARMLFDSLVKSNPKHSPGWIAAAALEEHAGRLVAARKLIKMGCEQCPKAEDVWLEAARLHVRSFLLRRSCLRADLGHRTMTMPKLYLLTPCSMSDKVLKYGWLQQIWSMTSKQRNESFEKVRSLILNTHVYSPY